MKAKNLKILSENGFAVPKFQVVHRHEDIDFSYFDGDIFAVRSNNEQEDGDKYSYAGQFLTLLNVSKDELREAIRSVILSYNKRDYEEKFEIKTEKAKSGVIIQEMVMADYSGILFTSNPKGILNDLVIVLGEGMGNKIVEDKKEVITCHYYGGIGYKEGKLFPFPEYLIEKLVLMGRDIEKLFKNPMDVEFAIRGEDIFVLQARKITGLDFSLPIRILDNSNIAESYPGVCSKLTRKCIQKFLKDLEAGYWVKTRQPIIQCLRIWSVTSGEECIMKSAVGMIY